MPGPNDIRSARGLDGTNRHTITKNCTVEPRLPDNLWDRHQAVALAGMVVLANFALEHPVCSNWSCIFKCSLVRVSMHNLKTKFGFYFKKTKHEYACI